MKEKKKSKKKLVLIIVATVVIIAMVTVLVVPRIMKSSMTKNLADNVASTEVTKGNISTTVTGSGNLEDNSVAVKLPYDIDIDDILVKKGESVSKGDPIFTIDSSSLSDVISDTKEDLEDVNDGIDEYKEKEKETIEIDSKVSGRVKKIYAKTGDKASSIVSSEGALMLISLNGKMSTTIKSSKSLSIGDKVKVVLSNGKKKTGTVESKSGSKYKITLTDKNVAYEDSVTITYKGNEIGNGTLQIDEPLKVTNDYGTIKSIEVSEGDYVESGTELMTVKKASAEKGYSSLINQRTQLLNLLDRLTSLAATHTIYAPNDGEISKISASEGSSVSEGSSDDSSTTNSDVEEGTVLTILADDTYAINVSVDELDISSLEKGQSATVEVDAVEDETFSGEVSEVSDSATVENGVANYTATIQVEKSAAMKAGMSATATIIEEEKNNVLTLPLDAIQEFGNEVFVYTKNEDGTLGGKTTITTGLSTDSTVEITSGLKENDTVYYMKAVSEDSEMMMPGGMGPMGEITVEEMPQGTEGPPSDGSGGPPSNGGSGGGTPPSGSGSGGSASSSGSGSSGSASLSGSSSDGSASLSDSSSNGSASLSGSSSDGYASPSSS